MGNERVSSELAGAERRRRESSRELVSWEANSMAGGPAKPESSRASHASHSKDVKFPASHSMKRITQRKWYEKVLQILGSMVAWTWTIVAGIGGIGLIITCGPLRLTNGWFALLSAIAACPLTAWLLKKYRGITMSGWTRFAAAVLIIAIGRLVLKIEGRGDFLPGTPQW